MSEAMPYGEVVQELTYLRAQYEQFIIDRERERIIKLLEELGEVTDYVEIRLDKLIALIKGEQK